MLQSYGVSNPLIEAICSGSFDQVRRLVEIEPRLLNVSNPEEDADFKPTAFLLGESTANMTPLQYALSLEDDVEDLSKIIYYLIEVFPFSCLNYSVCRPKSSTRASGVTITHLFIWHLIWASLKFVRQF